MQSVTSNAVNKERVNKSPYIELSGTGTVYDFINLLIAKGLYTLGEIKEISQVTLFDLSFSFVFTDYTESISTVNSTWIFRGVCSTLDANNSNNTFSIEVISRDGNVYYYNEDRPIYGGPHNWTKLI